MNISEKATLKIRQVLQSILPNKSIKCKSLFSGYGLFIDNHMFAIYKNDKFYLRAEAELGGEIKNYSLDLYKSPQKSFSSQMNYFYIDERYFENSILIKRLILQSLQQIQQQKLNKNLVGQKKLRILPNINIKLERLLAKINIFSVEDLQKIGPELVYIKLKKLGFDIKIQLYWTIYAGLKRKNIFLLTLQEKQESLAILNQYLYEHNLQQEKWPYNI